ncbi:restriction endonuclease subunit S [Bacillus wiedmannii]|uniref:restriction endonuclease subunit S n=1 Tax=Bacillus wiedmannii TaxID=1890302 RepID=UPI000BEF973E|nr:restriction endonuclease subunit S [Bacillus wiedmannii]PEL97507.1 restriction endonuclease subunit S [Bacillus wiedmannii]PGB64605.1 restriction endonuclease subunit S [Bacillus wiedmannii]
MITRYKSYPTYKDSKISWMGEIPSEWGTSKLKFQTNINKNNLAENTDPFYEIQYVDIGNVDSNGQIGELQRYYFEQAPSRARRIVRSGDTLISTVRTYLKAITSVKEAPSNLICSTGFVVLTPEKSIDSLYLSYLVRSDIYVDEIVSRSVGVSYPAINASEIGNLECILPDLKTQEKIGKFLEKKSNDIKHLINGKQKLIGLLEAKRQSMITEAITKGLNPNVKMKDSGVEWIGKIPEHWSVKQLNHITSRIGVGLATSVTEYYRETGIPIIRNLNIKENYFDDSRMIYLEEGFSYKEKSKMVRENDVILVHTGSNIGLACVVPENYDLCHTFTTLIVTGEKDRVLPEYLSYHFNSHLGKYQVQILKEGMGKDNLNVGQFKFYKLTLPCIEEQREIVLYLNREITHIDIIIRNLTEQIQKLKDYRQSLIYEAVTGKIDVRDFEVKA